MDQQNTPPQPATTEAVQQPVQAEPIPVSQPTMPTQPLSTPTTTTPPSTETPPAPPTTNQNTNVPEVKKSSNKMFLIIIVLVALIIIGGTMLYLSMSKKKITQQTTETKQTYQLPTPTITPTTDEEIQAIDVGDKDTTDIQDIQKDVNGL